MRNIVILNSLHFSYPLPILMRVSYNTLIVKQNTSDYYKYSEKIAFYLISLLLSLYYVYFADTNTFHYFTIKIITR